MFMRVLVNKLVTNMKSELLQKAILSLVSALIGLGVGSWANNLKWSGIVETQLGYLREDMRRVTTYEPRIVRVEAYVEKHDEEISRLRGRLGLIDMTTGVPMMVDGKSKP